MATSKKTGKPSLAQIAEKYNAIAKKLGVKTVKRFSDRKSAERRLAEIKRQAQGSKKKATKKSAASGTRRKGFNFPVVEGGPKDIREDTNRAELVRLLDRPNGATFDECVQKAGFKDERNTYQAIRLLHTYCGFGLKDEDGRIYLVRS